MISQALIKWNYPGWGAYQLDVNVVIRPYFFSSQLMRDIWKGKIRIAREKRKINHERTGLQEPLKSKCHLEMFPMIQGSFYRRFWDKYCSAFLFQHFPFYLKDFWQLKKKSHYKTWKKSHPKIRSTSFAKQFSTMAAYVVMETTFEFSIS